MDQAHPNDGKYQLESYDPSVAMIVPPAPTTIISLSQTITSDAANPNTAGIKPKNVQSGAIYMQDPSITVYNVWHWSIDSQVWIQFSSPQ